MVVSLQLYFVGLSASFTLALSAFSPSVSISLFISMYISVSPDSLTG